MLYHGVIAGILELRALGRKTKRGRGVKPSLKDGSMGKRGSGFWVLPGEGPKHRTGGSSPPGGKRGGIDTGEAKKNS